MLMFTRMSPYSLIGYDCTSITSRELTMPPALKHVLYKLQRAKANLECLYQKWKQKLELQEQELARKSMADAAVSTASQSYCDLVPLSTSASSHLVSQAQTVLASTANSKKLDMTASWLDKAEQLLSQSVADRIMQCKIEDEMESISMLISEAPEIQAIAADLPKNLNSTGKFGAFNPHLKILSADSTTSCAQQPESTPDSPNNAMKLLASLSSQAAPVPVGETIAGANPEVDDAKTFVDFLQSMAHVKN